MEDIRLWEILVPTEIRNPVGKKLHYTTRYHKGWDARVEAISGGLTIMHAVKGKWTSLEDERFEERMIPVRFMATAEQANEIVDMTILYYDQLAILCYEISNNVIMRHRKDLK